MYLKTIIFKRIKLYLTTMEQFLKKFSQVEFSFSEGVFEISGNLIFTEKEWINIVDILNEYIKSPFANTKFCFKVHYLDGENSNNFISEIYQILQQVDNCIFYWYFDVDDEGGQEMGLDLKKELNIPFFIQELEF